MRKINFNNIFYLTYSTPDIIVLTCYYCKNVIAEAITMLFFSPLTWVWKLNFGWGWKAHLYHLLLCREVKIECLSVWPVTFSQWEKLMSGWWEDLETLIGLLYYVLMIWVHRHPSFSSRTQGYKNSLVASYNFMFLFILRKQISIGIILRLFNL